MFQEVEEAWNDEEKKEEKKEVNKTIMSLPEKKTEDCPGGM